MLEGKDKKYWNYVCSLQSEIHNSGFGISEENAILDPLELHPYHRAKPKEKAIPVISDLSFFSNILPNVNKQLEEQSKELNGK